MKTIPTTGKRAGSKPKTKNNKPSTEYFGADTADPLTEAPDFQLSTIQTEISEVETLIQSVEQMPENLLLDRIKLASARVDDYTFKARLSTAQSLLYVWATGTMLNATKKKLGHGHFSKWCHTHIVTAGIMSERTCQRYMKLATENPDISAFLEQGKSIRQSYIAAGVIAEPEEAPAATEKNGAPKSHALMSALSGLQKKLRLFSTSAERLTTEERNQLKLMKIELDRFFAQALAVGHHGEEQPS